MVQENSNKISAINPITVIFVQGITALAQVMFKSFIDEVSKHVINVVVTKLDLYLVENIKENNDVIVNENNLYLNHNNEDWF